LRLEEIIKRIDFGDDVAFECGGRHFVVCPTPEGCDIAESRTEKDRAVYPDGETLVNEYMIDGKSIKQRIEEIRLENC